MKKIIIFLLIAVGLFFLFKPSIKKENYKWDEKVAKIQTLKIDYPQFSDFIAAEYNDAIVIKENGDREKDEKEKLKYYQFANEKLENGVYQKLSFVLLNETKIEELIYKYKADRGRYEENKKIIALYEKAVEASDFAQNVTQGRAYDNKQDALAALALASNKINSSMSSLEKLMDQINKRDAKDYKDGDDNIPEQLKEAKSNSSSQTATCEYCGSSYSGSTCGSCGADKEVFNGTNKK
jgi:hypothetical protein